MWQRLSDLLPKIAGDPLAILAYIVVVAAWLLWLYRKIQVRGFLDALDRIPETERIAFVESAGYAYQDLAMLPKKERSRHLTRKMLLVGYTATLIAIVLIVVSTILALARREGSLIDRSVRIMNEAFIGELTFIRQESPDPQIQKALAEVMKFLDEGRYDVAEQVYSRIAKSLTGVDTKHNLAILAALNDRLGMAEQLLSEVLREDPAREDAEVALANVQTASGNYAGAAKVLEKIPSQQELRKRVELRIQEVSRSAVEIEPNSDFNTATSIPLYIPVRGEIVESGDVDYFKFTTPAGVRDWFHVQVSPTAASLAPELAFHDWDRDELKKTYTTTRGAFAEISMTGHPGVEYFVRVESWSGAGPYELTITPKKEYDRYEPNETLPTAVEIGLDEEIEASILDRDDSDCFRFPLNAVGKVSVAITGVSEKLAPRVTLYNSDKQEIGSRYETTKGANLRYFAATRSTGDHYVRVSSWSGQGNYRLKLSYASPESD